MSSNLYAASKETVWQHFSVKLQIFFCVRDGGRGGGDWKIWLAEELSSQLINKACIFPVEKLCVI